MSAPEGQVLFLDRSLAGLAASALSDAGAAVERHQDHFAPDAADADWLRDVGRRGWLVVTADKRIRLNPLERRALGESGVALFVLASGNMTGPEQARALAAALPRMLRFARRYDPPFVARIHRDGSIRLQWALDARRRGGRR